MPALFEIDDLRISTLGDGRRQPTEIVHGVSLIVDEGEAHVLVGPSGSGKTTLASTLLGAPGHQVTSGSVRFRGNDITAWDTDVRAKVGIFLAFQHPLELAGVSVLGLLRQALAARTGIDSSLTELRHTAIAWMTRLEIDHSFIDRFVDEGLSDLEKKQHELLQMALLEPAVAILDETSSDLDAPARHIVAGGVQEIRKERPTLGTLTVTHDHHLVAHLVPDFVHVMIDGKIVASGGPELAQTLDIDGYESFR